MARQLRGDEICGGGALREVAQHGDALLHAAFRVAFAEHALCARLVHLLAEHELTGRAAREASEVRADRPAGDDLGEARDISLRIAATDAEGLQLEDLARKILIDAEAALASAPRGALCKLRIGADGRLIVEIQKHRRMLS